ncbi:MAG: MFS transporter [Clostridia bacterium]|nr:MFS transporter [Clostridia bacterium]
MKISQSAKKAILVGSLCSISYFAVYISRNILGAVTPQMIEAGFEEGYIGTLSSLYFIFYAVGQLINGAIGDKIKAKWMISIGLFGAGVANLVFTRVTPTPCLAVAVYALAGFSLSMIYGPMTKVVAENTEPLHATRVSLGYTFASFFGSPAAGFLASLFVWERVFDISSAVLVVMAVAVVASFSILEGRGVIKYGQYKTEKRGVQNIKVLLEHSFVKFSLISILTGVVRTAVVAWMTTYFVQYLGYTSEESSVIYTVTTLFISLSSFIAIFLYERLGCNMNLSVLLFFSVSAFLFALLYFVSVPVVNIVIMVLAIMANDCAASILWSRYCPSLRDTGMVSGATGFLDFLSYMAAAGASAVFGFAAENSFGWDKLILVWFALMLVGVIISLPYKRKSKAEN